MKRSWCLASLLSALLVAATLYASPPEEGAQEGPKIKSSSCEACITKPRSALTALVDAAVSQLVPLPSSNILVAAPLVSEVPAPRGDALLTAVLAHLAGRLGPETRYAKTPSSLEAARLAAGENRVLSYAQLGIRNGRVSLRVDVYPVPQTVWQYARAPNPGPAKHAFSSAPVDAEVRAYLTPLGFEEPKVSRYGGVDAGVLAVACGDLDGDGRAEIITVSRRRVLSLRLRGDSVVRERAMLWPELSNVAPVPLREPLGFATIHPASSGMPGWVDVSLTDRAQSARLAADLKTLVRFDELAVPLDGRTGCTSLEGLYLAAPSKRCRNVDAPPLLAITTPRIDTLAASWVVDRSGQGHPYAALRSGRRLRVQGQGALRSLGVAGAQLAIGDIDLDGIPDVVSTRDGLRSEDDYIDVRSLLPSGTVKRRYQLMAPKGVRALTICPPDGPGRLPVLAISNRELWVLR